MRLGVFAEDGIVLLVVRAKQGLLMASTPLFAKERLSVPAWGVIKIILPPCLVLSDVL
jgi:hypothetical protein